MAKELFVAPMELKDGLNEEDLEKFWVEEYLPNISELPGYRVTLHKAVYGPRKGQYMYLGHFESRERAAELFPTMGDATGSEEWQQWTTGNPVWQKLMSYFNEKWYGEYNEYVEL
jgi:hypothetical protein